MPRAAGVRRVKSDAHRKHHRVWLYLRGELDTLDEAVHIARCRYYPRTLQQEEVVSIISVALERIEHPEITAVN